VHEIGAGHGGDTRVFAEEAEGCVVEVSATKDHEYVLVSSNSRGSSEVHLLEARDPLSGPALVQARTPGLLYFVQHWRGRLVILTNGGGGAAGPPGTSDYRVVTAPVGDPGRARWEPLVEARDGTHIDDMDLIGSTLVLLERRGGGDPGVSRECTPSPAPRTRRAPVPPGVPGCRPRPTPRRRPPPPPSWACPPSPRAGCPC